MKHWQSRVGNPGPWRTWILVWIDLNWQVDQLYVSVYEIYIYIYIYCSWSFLRSKYIYIYIYILLLIFSKEPLQRLCGAFLACVEVFKQRVPQSFLDKVLPEIKTTYLGCQIQIQSAHPQKTTYINIQWTYFSRCFATEVSLQTCWFGFRSAAAKLGTAMWYWICQDLRFPSSKLCSEGRLFFHNCNSHIAPFPFQCLIRSSMTKPPKLQSVLAGRTSERPWEPVPVMSAVFLPKVASCIVANHLATATTWCWQRPAEADRVVFQVWSVREATGWGQTMSNKLIFENIYLKNCLLLPGWIGYAVPRHQIQQRKSCCQQNDGSTA